VESEPGQGTTVVLDLPLSLALLRVVLVEADDELFGIPTAPIRRILHLSPLDRVQLQQGNLVEIGVEAIPLATLTALLDLPSAAPTDADETTLVIEARGGRFGVIVSAVRTEQELVFKELRGPVLDQRTFAGAALLGNGDIVPILDVQALFEIAVRTAGAQTVRPSAPAPIAGRTARVLVVEDSLVAGELEKGILLAAGYDTELAHDGVEALEVLRQKDWDLVISDVDMPRMDGFELTARLRADPRLRDIPVIIVTSRDTAEYRRRGFEAGANAYVTKREFDQTKILDTVRRLIGRQGNVPSAYSLDARERRDRV
jgi:two-component system chemotaxis sensor kinase CheA